MRSVRWGRMGDSSGMDVHAHVVAGSGIAHRTELAAAGFTRYRIRAAVADGSLRRLGRSWLVADAHADPTMLLAASVGGRVACASAAALLGLWTLEVPAPHIAIPPSSRMGRVDGLRLHRSIPLAPVRRTALVESIVDVLAHVAVCLPREAALAVWESAIRQRRIPAAALATVPWRTIAAQTLASAAGALADSGLESIVADRLRWMRLPVRQQVPLFGHRVDILVAERLVIQLDGWEHHSSAADRARDNRHDARLRAAGYRVIRIGYAEVVHGWPAIQAEIALAVAQRAHLAASGSAAAAWLHA